MLTVVSFIGFTALVALISYLKTRNDRMTGSDDYFLAGRSLTAWVIAGSLILTNLSTEQKYRSYPAPPVSQCACAFMRHAPYPAL